MIVFGTRGSVSKPQAIANFKCPECSSSNGFSSTVFNYFHIYWIPVIPTSKQPVLTCANCKLSLVGKEIDERINKFESNLRTEPTKRPIFHFAALALIMLGIISGVTNDIMTERAAKAFLQTPKVGDIVVTKLAVPIKIDKRKKLRYGAYRIEQVAQESLTVRKSKYAFQYSSDAEEELSKAGGVKAKGGSFVDETEMWKRENPAHMLKARRIQEILRIQAGT